MASRLVETALVAWDWAESFTAFSLVIRPAVEEGLLRTLGDAGRHNGDTLLGLLIDAQLLDAQRHRRWSSALVRMCLEQPENLAVLQGWIAKWEPLADAAIDAYCAALPDAAGAAARARVGHHASSGAAWGCERGHQRQPTPSHPHRERAGTSRSARTRMPCCAARCGQGWPLPTNAEWAAAGPAASSCWKARCRPCGRPRPASPSATASAASGWPASRARWATAASACASDLTPTYPPTPPQRSRAVLTGRRSVGGDMLELSLRVEGMPAFKAGQFALLYTRPA